MSIALDRKLPQHPMKILKAEDVVQLLSYLKSVEQEHLVVLGLTARHRVTTKHCIAIGTVDRVQVALRDVFRELVRHNCACCIAVHNHPSGEVDPSPQDEVLTQRLRQAGELLGIVLLDHIIIAKGGHYSFSDQGHLTAWVKRESTPEAR